MELKRDQNCVELAQGRITLAEFERRGWCREKKAEARRRRKAAYRMGKAEGRRPRWS